MHFQQGEGFSRGLMLCDCETSFTAVVAVVCGVAVVRCPHFITILHQKREFCSGCC